MQFISCLTMYLVFFHDVFCQNTVYKCKNTSEHVPAQVLKENATLKLQALESQFKNKKNNSSIFQTQTESFEGFISTLKRTMQVWKKIWNSSDILKKKLSELNFFPNELKTSEKGERTFGIRRRLQLFFILPISFKLGVIITLLMVLTAMSLKGLIIGFLILTLILINTNTHSKLWHTPKPTGLIDLDNRNVHIHVHALPVDSYYHGPHTMEAINNWHERSFHQSGQNSWHNLLSRITF